MRSLFSVVVMAGLAVSAAGVSHAQGPVQVARAAYTVEPFAPASEITIKGTGVRLRAEPFATPQTQVLSSGSTGLALTVVGIVRMSDWNWYQVVLKNGQKAFIRSDLTSAPSRGGAAAAPVAQPLTPPVLQQPPVIQPPPIPFTPPPIQIAPAQPAQPAQPYERPELDLPKPSGPSGLVSVDPAPIAPH